MAKKLSDLAPKWRSPSHIRSALREHLRDTMGSVGKVSEYGEMLDLKLIIEALMDTYTDNVDIGACGGEANEHPICSGEEALVRRLKAFERTAHLPELT